MIEYLDTAKRDFLTDCFAKEELDNILDRVLADCSSRKKQFSILVLDIDHFKAYNDNYGHLDGDEVLKYFASTLRLSFPEGDCIRLRFGGDEFIIIFPNKGVKEAHSLVSSCSKGLRKRPFLMRGRIFHMRFSGGLVSYPADGTDAEDLLRKADKAMYYSKMHGRGKTTYYNSMRLKTAKRLAVISIVVLVISGISYYTLHSERANIGHAIDRVRRGIDATIAPSSVDSNSMTRDNIYMKSGRVVSGTIISETENSVELRMDLAQGEGSVVINKQKIDRIERDAVNPAPPVENK